MTDTTAGPRTIRWGIAGPGRIAHTLASDIVHVDGAELIAVGSRSADRAAQFAERYGATHVHGSYRALIDDPDVDVIYVATPHPQHRDIAIAALDNGKAVLVEKSFTATLAGAEAIVAAARANRAFAMEAMWTRFQPTIVRLRELLAAGAIGELLSVQTDLGVGHTYNPHDRLFARELGGGAVLDMGVYLISFSQMILGTPERVVAHGFIGQGGVEMDATILLGFADGVSATMTTSLRSPMPGQGRIYGTEGWIDVLPRFHHPDQMVLHQKGSIPETIRAEPVGNGFSHQIAEVTECVRAGRTESAIMPLADTLVVQAIMEEVLDQLGADVAEADVEL